MIKIITVVAGFLPSSMSSVIRLLPHKAGVEIRDRAILVVPVGRFQTLILGVLTIERLTRDRERVP